MSVFIQLSYQVIIQFVAPACQERSGTKLHCLLLFQIDCE